MSNVIDTTSWSYSHDSHGNTQFYPDSSFSSQINIPAQISNYATVPMSVNSRNVASQYLGDSLNFGKLFSNTTNNALSNSDVSKLINGIQELNDIENQNNNATAINNAKLQYQMNLGLMREQAKINQNSAEKVMRFNSREADLNRKFQLELSNTAHQREIDDLKKAGLNPVLSAYNNGASTPQGNTAYGQYSGVSGTSVQQPHANSTNTASVIAQMIQALSQQATSVLIQNMADKSKTDTVNLQGEWNKAIEQLRQSNKVTDIMLGAGLTGIGYAAKGLFDKLLNGMKSTNGLFMSLIPPDLLRIAVGRYTGYNKNKI